MGQLSEWILEKKDGCGMDSSGSGKRPVAGSCEHGNETSGFIKTKEFVQVIISLARRTLLHCVC